MYYEKIQGSSTQFQLEAFYALLKTLELKLGDNSIILDSYFTSKIFDEDAFGFDFQIQDWSRYKNIQLNYVLEREHNDIYLTFKIGLDVMNHEDVIDVTLTSTVRSNIETGESPYIGIWQIPSSSYSFKDVLLLLETFQFIASLKTQASLLDYHTSTGVFYAMVIIDSILHTHNPTLTNWRTPNVITYLNPFINPTLDFIRESTQTLKELIRTYRKANPLDIDFFLIQNFSLEGDDEAKEQIVVYLRTFLLNIPLIDENPNVDFFIYRSNLLGCLKDIGALNSKVNELAKQEIDYSLTQVNSLNFELVKVEDNRSKYLNQSADLIICLEIPIELFNNS